MSDSLWPHGLQHSRLPCPSPTPGVCPSSCLLNWWCHPTISSLSPSSPSAFNLPQHQSLSHWVSWSKCWSFSFNIGPSKKYSGLISFKIDRFDLFSLLQHYSSKASVLCSAFFMGQLSHSYMTTGKTLALNIRTFVRKLMSLLNILI